ncbi:MAG: acyltransferase family protein [Cellulosilyticaceae bacterium]
MISSATTERNHLLDNLKGLLIFLVVFGHSLESFKDDSIIIHTLYAFIYLFHMPAFVFISGYLSKNVDKARETAFKNLFIPFLIFNSFWNLLHAIVAKDIRLFSFLIPGWTLWYLLSMFFWKIFLKDLIRIRYIVPLSFLVGIGVGIFSEFNTMLSLSRTLVFLPFFLVGYFTSEEQLFKLKRPHPIFSLMIISIAIASAVLLSISQIIPVEFLYGSQSFVSYTVPIGIGLIARCLLYLIGFSFVFALANTIPNTPSLLTRMGQHTFSIYVLHIYLLVVLFGITYVIPSFWLKIILSFVGSILISYVLSLPLVSHYFHIFVAKCSHLIVWPQK